MAVDRLDVKCQQCGHVMHVPLEPEFRGKKISFQCKNVACTHMLLVTVPQKGQKMMDSTSVSPRKQRKMISAELEVIPSDMTQADRFLVSEGSYLIGRRASGNDVQVPINTKDKSVSRQHCLLNVIMDRHGSLTFLLKDNGSKNGVLLNQKKLRESEEIHLMDGDTIELGSMTLVFHAHFENN